MKKLENLTEEARTSYEANKKLRRDWGSVNPVTRIIPDKRNKKPKHKKEGDYDYEY